jgi:hypothetical protein
LWANGEEVEQMDEQKRQERVERALLLPDGVYGVGDVVRREGRWYVESSVGSSGPFASYGRMDINAVLDPVPVRVDARMRPVTS